MIILAELSPLDTVAGTRKLLRASSANDPAVTGLNDQIWRPAISEEAQIGIRLFKGDFDGEAAPSGGNLTVQIDQWLTTEPNARRFVWQGAPVKIYAGVSGQAWPWTVVFDGLVDQFSAEANTVKLTTKVNTEPFDADVLTLKYAGTGGAEGDANIKDKVKPFLLGRCFNVEPILINAVDNVFQFSGYGAIQAVTTLYERGSAFGASSGNYATYAALVAATIAPGQWATCLAQGMIRLGAPPYGVITGDVDGDNVGGTWWRKTGEIIQRIASNSGVTGAQMETASFTALDTALAGLSNQGRIGLFIDSQITVLEMASTLAAPCNAQVGVSMTGKMFVGRVAIGSPTITLDAQQRQLPRVNACSEASVSPPFSYIEMGYARSWRTHTDDEITTDSSPEAGATRNVNRGAWSGASVAYAVGDFVQRDGSSYTVITAHTSTAGNGPPGANWSLLASAGLNGSSGLPGAAGTNGQTSYVHFAYANNATGTLDFTTGDAGGRFYIGTYTDFTEADSTSSTAYTWSLLRGQDGADGTPGAPGADGAATYVHIAYANNATGSSGFSTTDGAGKTYIGTYTDGTLADSTDAALYTWSLIKGDQGAQGAAGAAGANGADAITGFLTNEATTLAADSAGTVSDFAPAGGTFKVFQGIVDKTVNSVFSVSGTPTNCTVAINASTGVYSVSAMSADTASATLQAVFGGVTIQKILSLSKSRAGATGAQGTAGAAGANASVLTLSSTAQTITFDGTGTASPATQTITFTANLQNATGTATFAASAYNAAGTLLSNLTLGGTGNTRTLTNALFTGNAGTAYVVVTATLNTLSDTVTVVRLQAGATGAQGAAGSNGSNGANGVTPIVGFLTNEATTLSADSAGAVSDFAPAGGTFKMFEGVTDRTTVSVFSVSGTPTNCTVAINASTGVYSVSAMSADTASAVLRGVYGGVTIDKVLSLSKSRTGAAGAQGAAGTNGANASVLVLTSTAQTVTFDGTGVASPASQTITFTPNLQNISGTVAYTATAYNSAGTNLGAITLGVSGNNRTMTNAQFTALTGTAYAVVTATLNTLSDTVTVVRLQAGATGATGAQGTAGSNGSNGTNGVTPIVGFLTNEATTLSADSAGTVSDFTPAGGTFKMFEGITDRTTSSTFSISGTPTNCTVAINATTGVYSVSAMTADTASATLRGVYGGVTIDKILSLSKSRTGAAGAQGAAGTNGAAGANASVLTLTSTAQTITFDGAGTASPASQTITLTANLQNLSGTATFVATGYNSANSSLGTIALGGTGNSRTLTNGQFTGLGATSYVVVTATLNTFSDTYTIVRLQAGATGAQGAAGTNGSNGAAGANAITGFLTNEATTLAADNAGTVSSFTPAAGTFKVFEGLTDRTASSIFSVASNTGCTVSIVSNTGAYSVSAMSADTATATLQATYSGATLQKILSLSKARAGAVGAQGNTGNTGAIGPQGPQGIQGLQGNTGLTGAAGSNGQTTYVHFAYADDATGNTNFTTGDAGNRFYIGTYTDFNPTDSNSPSAYAWSLIRGSNGAQGIQGPAGANGASTYVHIAYATSPTGSTGFSTTDGAGKTYIGTYTDGNLNDSESASAYTWSLIKGSDGAQGPIGNTGATGAVGPVGPQGPAGTNGTNGLPAVIGFLTNDSIQLFAYAEGTVTSYIGASGSFRVFSGNTDISSSFTLATGVSGNPQNLTVTYTNQSYSITGGFDTTEDTASLTIRATGTGTYAGVTLDKVVSLSKAKGGYEIVSVLPTTNNFAGRMVFLTALDGTNQPNKLYRYIGSPTNAYTAAVPATDVSGTLATSQIADSAVTAVKIGAGAVETAKIADAAIAAAKIADSAVGSGKLADNAVTTAKINAAAIETAKIADSAITTIKIGTDAVTAAKILAGSITAVKIAADAVEADKIAANAVTADKINANAVTAGKIAAGSIATNSLIVTGRGAAINDDPLCQDPTAWQDGAHGTTAEQKTITDAPSGNTVYRSIPSPSGFNTGSSGIQTSKLYPVSSQKRYRFTAFLRSVSGTGVAYLRIVDQNGNQVYLSGFEGFTPASTWTRYSAIYQPDASVKSVRLRAILNWTGNTGYHEVTDFRLEEMAEADLIVDGSIIASKIATDAITATKISAGSIVSSKLAIGDTSNMYPDPDFVDLAAYSTANGTLSLVPTADPVASKNYLYTGPIYNEFTTIPSGVPVEPLKYYYFSCSAFTETGGDAWCYISWQSMAANGAQTEISVTTVVNGTVGSLTKGEVVAQAPSGARRAVMVFRNLGTGGKIARFGGPIIRRAMQGELVVDGTITASKIATDAVTANKIEAGSITAAKIATNAVTAAKIAANSITTNKLLVTGGGNAINDDPMFQDPSAWELSANATFGSGTGSDGAVASTYISSNVNQNEITYSAKRYPVGPGKRYRLSAMLFAATGNDRNMYIAVEFYSDTGGYIGSAATGWGGTLSGYVYGGQPPTNVWTRQGGQFGAGTGRPIPANARSAKIAIWFNYSSGSGLVLQACQDLRLEELVEAEVIVDGAIIADKIAANAVTAVKINADAVTADKIATDAVTANKIEAGAITAAKIATSAVTADKIDVASLSAISATIGTLQSATTGARVQIKDNIITVFDTGNVVRVKIGDLS